MDSTTPPLEGPDGSTAGRLYAERLLALELAPWKQRLRVQAPYRRKIQSIVSGPVLDVGCGIGRHLIHLPKGSVGVDHNPHSIEVARSRGAEAYTIDEFMQRGDAVKFDHLLASHFIEHMPFDNAVEAISGYLPFLTDRKHCILICPQELGYKTDSTHVQFADYAYLARVAKELGLRVFKEESFPLPRFAGRVMPYNEFIVQAEVRR